MWARERQPSGLLRCGTCGSSQRRSGSRACTEEDFTDVQLKTWALRVWQFLLSCWSEVLQQRHVRTVQMSS